MHPAESEQDQLVKLARRIDELSGAIGRKPRYESGVTDIIRQLELSPEEARELARVLEALAFIYRVHEPLDDSSASSPGDA